MWRTLWASKLSRQEFGKSRPIASLNDDMLTLWLAVSEKVQGLGSIAAPFHVLLAQNIRSMLLVVCIFEASSLLNPRLLQL